VLIGGTIWARLDGRDILHGITHFIRSGSFTANAWPNGSGYSTLLRTIPGEIADHRSIRPNATEHAGAAPRDPRWPCAFRRGGLSAHCTGDRAPRVAAGYARRAR
jgi:hypothetical protein